MFKGCARAQDCEGKLHHASRRLSSTLSRHHVGDEIDDSSSFVIASLDGMAIACSHAHCMQVVCLASIHRGSACRAPDVVLKALARQEFPCVASGHRLATQDRRSPEGARIRQARHAMRDTLDSCADSSLHQLLQAPAEVLPCVDAPAEELQGAVALLLVFAQQG